MLRISERELKGLTPVGRKEIERRQQLATDVGRKAWLIGGGLGVVGIGLLIYSLPRLRKREATEDRRSQAELDQLIRKQDPREREESAEREASEELAAQLAGQPGNAAAARSDEGAVTAPQTAGEPGEETQIRDDGAEELEEREAEPDLMSALRESLDAVRARDASSDADRRAHEGEDMPDLKKAIRRSLDAVRARTTTVEERVVSHVRSIAPPWYQVREFVTVGSDLQLDALLASDIDQLRDIVVEVSLVREETLTARLLVAADRAIAHAARYNALTGRAASPWLIAVVEGLYADVVPERVARIIEPLAEQAIVSLVSEMRITELRFPPNLNIGPRGAA